MSDRPNHAERPSRFPALHELAAALPPGTPITLPREWILEMLGVCSALRPAEAPRADLPPPDLTVTELAQRFNRKPSTIRAWVEAGRFPKVYRLGREWRIPAEGVLAFEAAVRAASHGLPSRPPKAGRVHGVDLGDWRKVG